MGIFLKYVVASVAAKISLVFTGSIREMPKNRSKFTKNAIFTYSSLLSIKALGVFLAIE